MTLDDLETSEHDRPFGYLRGGVLVAVALAVAIETLVVALILYLT